MRIAIQAVISDVEGQEPRTEDIGVLEYDAETAPASGLGLFIGEAHQLLRQLQTVVLREQAARFLERVSRCRQCGSHLGVKDSKTIVYRTVYGKAHLDSPRLYSTCGRCGARATPARSVSPLADALPERTHPQWLWLQSRYAAVMSYRQAQTFLRDAYPAGRSLPVSSMKVNVLHTGRRLESEVQLVARTFVHRPRRCRSRQPAIEQQPTQGSQIELGINAGYIRTLPEKEGVRHLAIVASKLVRPVACYPRHRKSGSGRAAGLAGCLPTFLATPKMHFTQAWVVSRAGACTGRANRAKQSLLSRTNDWPA